MSDKLIIGYDKASQLTGIPKTQLKRMAERRSIRVIRLSKKSAAFIPAELWADIRALQTDKI